MPEDRQPPVVQPLHLDSEPLKTAQDDLSSQYALSLVNQTFYEWEAFRSQNHDKRWNAHDALYLGYIPPRVWDGTNIPRAAFSTRIVFDQVEAMVPAVSQALFNVGPDWFQVSAEPGTDPKEAREIQDVMAYYLEHPKSDVANSAIAENELAIKSMGLYGNGGVAIEWIDGRPSWTSIDLREFYTDPGTPTPSIDDGRATIRRKMMTVEEVLALKSDPRMSIPDGNILYTMAKNYPLTQADNTKQVQEALRGVYYAPGTSDFTPYPADRKLEVLIYYSKARIIWVLNRQWVAYNSPNPYGFVPFVFAPCYTFPGRFYAQSIGDVQEDYQRVIDALLSGHLDEVSLALHPPRAIPRGSMMTPAQQKWRPGAVYAYDNPKDVNILQPQPMTMNVFNDVQYIEVAAEKRTGINSLSSGVPRPSNANRTATGMGMQIQGSGNRLSYLVGNVEKYLLLPGLYKMFRLLQFHTKPGDSLPAYNSEKGRYDVDASVLSKKIRFRMNAASRMVTRDRLMQVFPFLTQYLMQGPLLEQLQKTGKTVDYETFVQMLQDATSVGQIYPIIRSMTPEEQQAINQPPPELVMQQQQQQQELQTRMQIASEKNQTEIQKTILSKQPNPMEAQIEAQKAAMEMEQERQQGEQKMFLDAMMNKIKIDSKREETEMKLASKRAEMQLQGQEHQNTLQQGAMTHQMKMQQMMDQLTMKKYAKDQGLDGGDEEGNEKPSKSTSAPKKKDK